MGKADLFDTALVFENFPVDTGLLDDRDADFSVASVEVLGGTHFPLTVVIVPDRGELTFRIGVQLAGIDCLTDAGDLWSPMLAACAALAARQQPLVGRVALFEPARRIDLLANGYHRAPAPRSGSWPTRTARPVPVCTARVTSADGMRPVCCISSAAPTSS
ncbi:hypothetical protein [Nocardia sp. NPDC049707]|uniref:hypothetical protein n=1 Tax=Nocardia sp. NPDC049707 TaxID=3154735 RepID=UPI00341AAC61